MTLVHDQVLIRLRSTLPILWKSRLSDDVTSGTGVFIPVDGVNIPSGGHAIIGFLGTSANELVEISGAVTTSGFTAPTLKDNYNLGSPVQITEFSEFKISESETPDGSFADVVSGDISSLGNPDGLIFSDFTIDDSKYYKITYGNDDGFQDTDDVEPFQLTTAGARKGYTNIDRVIVEAGLNSYDYSIPSDLVTEDIEAAESQIDAVLRTQDYNTPLTDPPGFVKRSARLLAAGYTMVREYGEETEAGQRGLQKIDQGNQILSGIVDGIYNIGNGTADGGTGAGTGSIQYFPGDDQIRAFKRDSIF